MVHNCPIVFAGVFVVAALGIALGVLAGCTMLGLAAMCHKYRFDDNLKYVNISFRRTKVLFV
jgi:hypothetical protein